MENYFNNTEDVKFIVAYNNDKSIIHASELQPNQQVTTGQENLDIYDTVDDVLNEHGQEVVDMIYPE